MEPVINAAVPAGSNRIHQSTTLIAQLWIFWVKHFTTMVTKKIYKPPSGHHKSPLCLCDITYVISLFFLQFMVVIPKLCMHM